MIKEVLKKFSTYGLGNILQTALRFILIPIYLRFFPPEDYGVISVLSVVMGLVSIFMGAGTMNGLIRLYYENDEEKRRVLVGTTWITYLLLSVFGGLLIAGMSRTLSVWLFKTTVHGASIRMLAVFFFFNTIQQVPFNVLRLNNQAGRYVAVSMVKFLLDFGLKYVFIVTLGRSVLGYFETSAIVNVVTLVLLIILSRNTVKLHFNRRFFIELVRLGSPYIISGFAVWILEVSNRLILNQITGTDAVGIFSLGYSFANMFGVVLASPVGLLLDPFFFKRAAERSEAQTKILLKQIMSISIVAGGVVFLLITLGSADLLRIFTQYLKTNTRYLSAMYLIPILTAAPLMYFLSTPATLSGLLIKKPGVTSIIFAVSAGFNAGLSFLLIPLFGALGAALATVFAYLGMLIALYVWIERAYTVRYPWLRLMLAVICLAGLVVGALYLVIPNPFLSLMVRCGVSVVAFVTLCFALLPTVEERRIILSRAKRALHCS